MKPRATSRRSTRASSPPLPALLVLHGTSGFTDGCGATADSSLGQIAAAIASSGYIVVVPDYIGLKSTPPPTGFPHPYLVGQATVPFAAQSGVTAIAAAYGHTVALKSNGSVVAWGWNYYGQTTVPVAAAMVQCAYGMPPSGWGFGSWTNFTKARAQYLLFAAGKVLVSRMNAEPWPRPIISASPMN